jgi:hypothetical protein
MSLLLVFLLSCDAPSRAGGDTTTVASGPATRPAPAPQARPSTNIMPCVSTWPTAVRLTGVVRAEQRFGPRGYGETPDKDRKVEILVLHLAQNIDVCADSTRGDAHPAVNGVRELQLTGTLDPDRVKRMTGTTLRVFGTLQRRAWGSDYTDVLIRVDSIPGLQAAPQQTAFRGVARSSITTVLVARREVRTWACTMSHVDPAGRV